MEANLADKLPSKREIAAEKCRRHFDYFYRRAWPQVEPNDLQWNWHLEAITDRLQRVTEGEIQNLVICIPPGFTKSLSVSVLWPAWCWLRDPTERAQYLSGSESVQVRDARRCRRLLKSDWYRAIKRALGLKWRFSPDQDQKTHYANTAGGERMSGVIGGKITGDRADKQVLDDPYDIKEATRGSQSRVRERMREVVRDWDDVLTDRLNDEESNPRVLIQHRVHRADLAGELLDRDGYDALVIRQEYQPDDPHELPEDPRSEAGELLHPERMGRETVEKRKRSSVYPATNNQNPQSDEGGIFQVGYFYQTDRKRSLLETITYRRGDLPDRGEYEFLAQSWDFSQGSTSSDASYVVGHVWGWAPPYFWLWPYEKREQCRFPRMKELVGELTDATGVEAKLVENKASGPQIVQSLDRKIGGFIEVEPEGAKDERADVAADVFERGNVRIPHPSLAGWVRAWAQELLTFPAEPDDRVDTTSQFILYCRDRPRSSKLSAKSIDMGYDL